MKRDSERQTGEERDSERQTGDERQTGKERDKESPDRGREAERERER